MTENQIIHQFWHSRNSPPELPLFVQISLWSFARFPQHTVYLWSYQHFPWTQLPANVSCMEASMLLSMEKFGYYLTNGVGLEHISDVIRLLALKEYGGWWVDSDNIALRPFSSYESPYAFHTLNNKKNGFNKVTKNFDFPSLIEKLASQQPAPLWDGKDMFNTGVIKSPAHSPFIEHCIRETVVEIDKMIQFIQNGGCVNRGSANKNSKYPNWLSMMKIVKNAITMYQLEDYVQPPIVFSPWHTIGADAFGERVKFPQGGPYAWYGNVEHDIYTLLHIDRCFCIQLHGEKKYTYSAKSLLMLQSLLSVR